MKKLISIVVPVFNEAENVEPFYEALCPILGSLSARYDFELLFTDNHSSDDTFRLLEELAEKDKRIWAIRFSRNFGYQKSILSGYVNARGDAAIQLDCDLEDPPALIPEFLRLWESGYQVVYGIRRVRRESVWLHGMRKLFYRLINLLSEEDLPVDSGDFRLVDARILRELRKIQDQAPYLRGIIATMGFRQIGVPYDRAARQRGKSKFKFWDLARLAMDGVVSHSVVPLRLSTYLGLAISVLMCLGIVGYAFAHFLFGSSWPKGFATTTILLLGGISLNALFLGIIGEYIGRIYGQIRGGPLTIVERNIPAVPPMQSAAERDWSEEKGGVERP